LGGEEEVADTGAARAGHFQKLQLLKTLERKNSCAGAWKPGQM